MITDVVTLSVRGDKAVMKKLRKLPRTVAKKVITRAARVAMKPMLKAARENCPVNKHPRPGDEPAFLRKSIKIRALKKNRRGEIGVLVGTSDKWFKGQTFYGAFQEFGWRVGKRPNRRSLQTDLRRQVPGKHFMERAYDSHSEQALRTFLDEVPRQIETAMATGGK